jgi:hypothetical protein
MDSGPKMIIFCANVTPWIATSYRAVNKRFWATFPFTMAVTTKSSRRSWTFLHETTGPNCGSAKATLHDAFTRHPRMWQPLRERDQESRQRSVE